MSNPVLSSVQLQVLSLIAAGSTARAAAETAGIHRNTISNWLCLSAFRQALDCAQYEKALFLREQAESLAVASYDAVRALLADPATAPAVRLKAALAMIDRATAPLPDPPAYIPEIVHKDAQIPLVPHVRTTPKIGRNEPCPCRSGLKFKLCCLDKPNPPAT